MLVSIGAALHGITAAATRDTLVASVQGVGVLSGKAGPPTPLRRALGRRRLLFHNSHMGEIRIELEREEDGRWIAEITAVPGVMAYGQTANDALQKVSSLLSQVLDERVSAGEITKQEAAEALKGLAA